MHCPSSWLCRDDVMLHTSEQGPNSLLYPCSCTLTFHPGSAATEKHWKAVDPQNDQAEDQALLVR